MSLEPGDHIWYWNGQLSFEINIPRALWFPGADPKNPTDYQGNGKNIYNFVVYEAEIVRGRPHMRNHEGSYAWLNNNPGNITGRPGGPDYGQYPNKFNWHNFLIFPTWEAGYAAIAMLLRSPKYVNLSILDAFKIYAPEKDGNNPTAYARDVATALGVPDSTKIGDLDDDQMIAVQNKITEVEGALAGDSFSYDSPELPDEIKSLLQ
jgi:hypothetical protein